MKKIAALLFIGLLYPQWSVAQTVHSGTAARKPVAASSPLAIEKAQWDSFWQIVGISEDQFHSLGLDTLNLDQGSQLFNWMFSNRATFDCGRSYAPPNAREELKFVHAYVEGGNIDSSDFAAKLKSQLATIQDVQLVPADSAADIIVSVIAIAPASNVPGASYIATVNVLRSCTNTIPSGLNQGTSALRQFVDSFVQVAPDEPAVISRVIASLNAGDFEQVRMANAQHARSLNAPPVPFR